jgi:hypothetical protein
MNPQPEPYVGHIFALMFAGLVVYLTIKAYLKADSSCTNDLFIIGYMEDSPRVVNNIKVTTLDKPRVVNNIKVTTLDKPSIESQQLYIDCVEALRALGMKKSEATRVTKRVFSSNQIPQSVQEFLLIALKK